MRSLVVRIAVWLLIAFLALTVLISLPFAVPRIAFSLVTGWWGFLERVLPSITVNWSGIGMAVGCSLLIVLGMHSLAGWLFNHSSRLLKPNSELAWRWTWTLALYLGIWLLFIAIMGAVGVAHQVGWLMRSNEPVVVQRRLFGESKLELHSLGTVLFDAAEESKWNGDTARRRFWTDREVKEYRIDDFHVVLLLGTNRELVRGLIFHRDPAVRVRDGFAQVSPAHLLEFRPADELDGVLDRHQSPAGERPQADR